MQACEGEGLVAPAGVRPPWRWLVLLGFGHALWGAVVVGQSWIQDIIINLVITRPHCGVSRSSGNIYSPSLYKGAFFQFELLSGILEIR